MTKSCLVSKGPDIPTNTVLQSPLRAGTVALAALCSTDTLTFCIPDELDQELERQSVVGILLVAVALLLLGKPSSRYLVYALAGVYVGTWLRYTIPAVANIKWNEQPWQVNVLMFVPGVALVIVPAGYCAYVAKTYIPQFARRAENPQRGPDQS